MSATPGRRRIRVWIGLIGVVLAAALLPGHLAPADVSGSPAGHPSGVQPTIVLVHGAWADGSSWSKVTQRLQRAGYTVLVQLASVPGSDLAGDPTTKFDFVQYPGAPAG